MKQVTELPEWFKELSEDSLLSSEQVASLFGYRNSNSFLAAVRANTFPRADVYNSKIPCKFSYNKSYYSWTKSTILQVIKRRNRSVNKQLEESFDFPEGITTTVVPLDKEFAKHGTS